MAAGVCWNLIHQEEEEEDLIHQEAEEEEGEVHTKDRTDTFTCCPIYPIRAAIFAIRRLHPCPRPRLSSAAICGMTCCTKRGKDVLYDSLFPNLAWRREPTQINSTSLAMGMCVCLFVCGFQHELLIPKYPIFKQLYNNQHSA